MDWRERERETEKDKTMQHEMGKYDVGKRIVFYEQYIESNTPRLPR